MAPFSIVILVGTDHHAFQRAVEWADRRSETHPQDKVFIQYGRTTAPKRADGAAFLSPAEMREAVAGADVVITHGGPGTISDARSGGHLPIVFPRDPQHGEHVDDHQQRFAAWCDRRGLVRFARTTDDLDRIVGRLPAAGTREDRTDQSASAEAIAAVATLLDAPLAKRPVAPGAPIVVHLTGDQAEVSAAAEALAGLPDVAVLGAVGDVARAKPACVRCGCGETFEACELWSAVGAHAFGGWASDEARKLSPDAPAQSGRFRPTRGDRDALIAFAAPYQAVYRSVWALIQPRTLVDTTPGVVAALSHDAGIDLRVIHFGAAAPRAFRRRKLTVQTASLQSFMAAPQAFLDRLVPAGSASATTRSHPLDARLTHG